MDPAPGGDRAVAARIHRSYRRARHACLVGTVLSAVNQGTLIISGEAVAATWARLAVNYLVPYLVAGTGWLSARRVRAAPRSRRHSEHETP
ncbi:nitrate/nitrite transporter NrtS [Streptomyces sp. NBC_01092]|uniref:nitrate/nitrite transporter NrtS n=1 Tax=Streptomyces sp. NBC_01092 TaxID=2903748 RepID=UPI00386E9DC7|nr:nitrate/nitrite transporter NrtS [Streptomyces sp. NBC_01092]